MLFAIFIGISSVVVLALICIGVYVIYQKKNRSGEHQARESVSSVKTVVAAKDSEDPESVSVLKDGGKTTQSYSHLKTRFTAIGVFVAAAFTVLGAKLFSMQVVNGEAYKKKASENAVTSVKTPAPRGNIYDADGKVLVKNRSSVAILAEGDVANNRDSVNRLSVILGLPVNIIKKRIQDQSSGAQSQRLVANDVTKKQAAFIAEHQSAFTGVSVQTRTVREYPYGALAAHVLGYTGIADDNDMAKIYEGRTIEAGDIVGKSGIEESYDSILSGDHGERKVVTDADGQILSVKSEIAPVKGSDTYLTLRAPVQSITDALLASTIAPENGVIGTGKGTAGSLVVMDVTDGSIIAMSNYPTFKPEVFTNGISQDTWNLYNTEESYYPMFNRAIAGTYPAASTFKAFSGMAGLTYGYASSSSTWTCKGTWDGFHSNNWQNCWLKTGHGTLGFREGIIQSCDVVFYEIAKSFFDNQDVIGKDAMQNEIKKYNFGSLSGIDLSGEQAGRIPTEEWKAEYFKDVPTESSWLGGDMTNMAIGQGYVLITPIQLAAAYGGIATGKVMKPHILKEVKNELGNTVVTKQAEVIAVPDVNPTHLEIIRDALHGVATENASVAKQFTSRGIEACAKTGTAEVAGKGDFAWTAAYAPYDNPKYVVTCIVEEGGGGSDAATPIAAEALSAALKYSEGTLENKVDYIAGSTGKSVELKTSSGSRTD